MCEIIFLLADYVSAESAWGCPWLGMCTVWTRLSRLYQSEWVVMKLCIKLIIVLSFWLCTHRFLVSNRCRYWWYTFCHFQKFHWKKIIASTVSSFGSWAWNPKLIKISNGNRTEWTTIQGVIGWVISNQLSVWLIWNYEHDYPWIVQNKVL